MLIDRVFLARLNNTRARTPVPCGDRTVSSLPMGTNGMHQEVSVQQCSPMRTTYMPEVAGVNCAAYPLARGA